MDMKELSRQAEGIVNEQIEVANKLIEIIDREHAALRENQYPVVESLAENKATEVLHLEQLDMKKRNVFALIDSNVVKNQQNPHLVLLEGQLDTLITQCQQKNQINGAIIAVSHQFAQRAMAILRGQKPLEQAELLYGRNGQTERQFDPLTLTKA